MIKLIYTCIIIITITIIIIIIIIIITIITIIIIITLELRLCKKIDNSKLIYTIYTYIYIYITYMYYLDIYYIYNNESNKRVCAWYRQRVLPPAPARGYRR